MSAVPPTAGPLSPVAPPPVPIAPPPAPPTLSPEAKALAQLQYNHIEQQAALATTKASLLVTAHSIIFATFVSLAKDCAVFTSLGLSLAGVFFGACGLALLAGLLCALVAVYPRTRPNSPDDVLYFANVVKAWPSSALFQDAFVQRDRRGYLDSDVLLNIYGKSGWLMRNFRWVQASLWATGIGTILGVVAIFPLQGILRIVCSK